VREQGKASRSRGEHRGSRGSTGGVSERVKIMRLLVANRIPPGHREESTNLQDEIGSVTEDLDHRSDHPGELDNFDDDLPASMSDIFDDERGVPNFGTQGANDIEDDDKG